MLKTDSANNIQHVLLPVILLIITLVALFLVYRDGIYELVNRWNKQEEYSHGYFIPLVVLYFIYTKRNKILSVKENPSWLGLILIIAALIIAAVGELSAIYIFVQYSLIVLLLGLVLSIAGKEVLKVTWIPILIGLFAIPLPYLIESTLTWRLQIISSELGVAIIRLFNIPVYLEGNVIDLGNYKIQVVEACSGLNYLFPLMSFGFILAYIFRASLLFKSILFLSTIPITLLMNSFRIGVVGIMVTYYGIEMAEGFLHYFEGWLIFMTCLGLLFLEVWFLTRIMPERPKVSSVLVVNTPKDSYIRLFNLRTSGPFLSSVAIIIFAAFVIVDLSSREGTALERENFATFPEEIDEWSLTKSNLTPSIIQQLAFDDYFLGKYVNSKAQLVELYIAYYASQRKGVSPHSPKVCIPGGGWQITSIETELVKLNNNVNIPINRILIEKNGEKQLVYYWFEQRGRSIANEYWMKWYLLKDAITKNRTDGALIRFATYIDPDNPEIVADERIKRLIKVVYPVLENYVPK